VVALGDLAVFVALVIEFRHATGEVFLFLFERAEGIENGHAFGEDGAAGEIDAVLREVAGADAFGGVDAAVIEVFDAGEDFEKRGFAGAVGADDADALLGRDEPVQVFKQDAGAEAFPGFGKLNHVGLWRDAVKTIIARGGRGSWVVGGGSNTNGPAETPLVKGGGPLPRNPAECHRGPEFPPETCCVDHRA